MNTKIHYLYRDKCNYKMHGYEVLRGEITEEQKAVISQCLEDGYKFVPSRVNLPEHRFASFTEDDVPWFELYPENDFSSTTEAPTVTISLEDLVNSFRTANGAWDEGCVTISRDEMRIRVEGGYLVATPGLEDGYPGIDVEFIPDDRTAWGTFPRVLLEKPRGESVQALIWANQETEDHSEKIVWNERSN